MPSLIALFDECEARALSCELYFNDVTQTQIGSHNKTVFQDVLLVSREKLHINRVKY